MPLAPLCRSGSEAFGHFALEHSGAADHPGRGSRAHERRSVMRCYMGNFRSRRISVRRDRSAPDRASENRHRGCAPTVRGSCSGDILCSRRRFRPLFTPWPPAMRYLVSTPIPGPTSITGSPLKSSRVEAMRAAMLSSVRKCCPRAFFGRTGEPAPAPPRFSVYCHSFSAIRDFQLQR